MQTRGHSLGSLPPELGVTAEKLGRDVFNTTYYPKGEDADASRKPWVVIDAAGLRLGRLSTVAATYLRGGNSGCYTPAFNMGVNVVVINADKIVVTGNKANQKLYYTLGVRGKPGSMKELDHSRIGPGMEVCFIVTFRPQEVKEYKVGLVCVTEREKFVVPVSQCP